MPDAQSASSGARETWLDRMAREREEDLAHAKKNFPWAVCPKCGEQCVAEPGCPGYGTPKDKGGSGVMVCWPPSSCGNATEWRCSADIDDCDWSYTIPYNEHRHPQDGPRPDWVREVF